MTSARILLVEDNLGDARLVSTLLEGSALDPIDIVHVRDLAAATATLARERFDAIVLDLGLPDSSGLDTLQRVRPADGGVPLVVLSGCDDTRLRARATELGAADFVSKDELDEFRLARCIESALARARLESQLGDAQRDAQSSDARLVDLMLHAFEPMMVLSMQHRVLFANLAAADVLGLPRDRLVGALLRLPVGEGSTQWIETTALGAPARAGRMGVRSVSTQWDRKPAWLVVLDPSRESRAEHSSPGFVSPAVAASASEIHARALRGAAGIETATTQIRKARELLRGWARHHSATETRALLDEVLEVAANTLDDATREISRLEGVAHHVLRNNCGSGRVRELGTLDTVIRDAIQRAAAQIGKAVQVKFSHQASGVLASDVPRVAPLVEHLVVGLGKWLVTDASNGLDLHVDTRVVAGSVVLTVDLDPGDPSCSRSNWRADRLVTHPVDRMTETEGAIDRVVRSLRDLGAEVSFGKRNDGTVWVELRVPTG
jgi:DNA-binding response OmpR family regulator